MSISCGIQCMSCDYPIHFDTYKGCSHACKYCFVKQKYDISNIEKQSTTISLRNFIEGKRNFETKWCDWNIPLHWGGNSDPFQECELEHKCSLECLKIFAETKYPFIVSTKNPVMLTKEPYFSLISQCRCVLQISMGCGKYDALETGAPSYEKRLRAAHILSRHVTRVIARVRPYFPDCHKDILRELPRYADAGIYGISISSFVSKKKQKGMKRYGTNYCFPTELLAPKLKEIKRKCHEVGLAFFCCEADLDHWSDDLACCGTMGLEDFKPNTFNIQHLAHGITEPTKQMQEIGTTRPFRSRKQSQAWELHIKDRSFEDMMHEIGDDYVYRYQELRRKYGG